MTQREVCGVVVVGHGDDLLPVDENQPALLAACEAAFSPVERERTRRPGRPGRLALAGG